MFNKNICDLKLSALISNLIDLKINYDKNSMEQLQNIEDIIEEIDNRFWAIKDNSNNLYSLEEKLNNLSDNLTYEIRNLEHKVFRG